MPLPKQNAHYAYADYCTWDDSARWELIEGVPHVMSPALSTARHDRLLKFQQYRRAGVREYWIVDPETRSVQAHTLRDGLYFTRMYPDTENAAPVEVLEGCSIDLREVFPPENSGEETL